MRIKIITALYSALFFCWPQAQAAVMMHSQTTTTSRVNKYVIGDKLIWKRIRASANTYDFARSYCAQIKKDVQLIELGLVEGATKLIRFMCVER